MSELDYKFQNTQRAFTALQSMLQRDHDDEAVRDSIIKRFEFTVELLWKLYKKYFEISSHKLNSPKSVFRELLNYQILTEAEVEQCLEMIDIRNISSHEYDSNKASEIVEIIPNFMPLIQKMLDHISASELG